MPDYTKKMSEVEASNFEAEHPNAVITDLTMFEDEDGNHDAIVEYTEFPSTDF